MKAITTFLTMVAMLAIGLLLAVAVLDPLQATVQSYDLNGMGSTVDSIHVTLVKYMVLVSIGTTLLWTVFRILFKERQRVN
jgi:uncharacterized BrkB/YihY/UPF0761 family membrane protein